MRYPCTNWWCLDSWHYTPRCPRRYPSDGVPARRHFTATEMAWARKRREAQEAGDFDLRRTPVYMRERREAEDAQGRPGHGWLVVFVPVAAVVALTMLILILYT
ncbi:hypothetical protein [Nocardia sp. NPDC051570]|uniref:hypothetical protein n=1 Tax=Nocardia sp. NPDC051570 TaxID=3364324 RepID=UPI0037ADA8AF